MESVRPKYEKPPECEGCPWKDRGFGYVPPCGGCSNGIVLVNKCPDIDGVVGGRHFSGRAADVMRRAFRWVPAKEEEYGVISTVQCRPRSMDLRENEYYNEARDHCKRLRDKAIRGWNPKAIVPLGPEALEAFTGVPADNRTRGYRYDCPGYPPIIGSFDPYEVGAGNMGLLFTVRFDLASAERKSKPDWGAEPKKFHLCPTPEEFIEWARKVAREAEWVVADIETPWSGGEDEDELTFKSPNMTIVRCSFCASIDATEAWTIPWMPPFLEGAAIILESGVDKVFWNGMFDIPRLEHDGYAVRGRHIDAMWLWHFLQPDLPKALAHAATYFTDLREWKSAGSNRDPEIYSCNDAYGEAQCFLKIVAGLRKHGMWDIATKHVIEFLPVLEAMSKRGVRIDTSALAELRSEFGKQLAQMDEVILGLYPDELKKVKWYKKVPKEVKNGAKGKTIGGKPGVFVQDNDGRWGLRFEFNPAATQQVQEYLRYKKIKVPLDHKTKRPTTGAKHLGRIFSRTGDQMLGKLLERRKVEKVFSTYTNYVVDERGRISPSFGLEPATGRLNCKRPNLQNIPNDAKLGKLIRKCFIASEGCTLLAADFVGMESFLVGYFADDPLYMKLATKNIYAYVMAHYYGETLPEIDSPEFDRALTRIKARDKDEYKKWKSTILGIGYGEGPVTMARNNPGVFASEAEAEKLKKFVLDTFPKVRDWQDHIKVIAAKEGRIFNPYRYVRWFLDVPGSQIPQALAQLPQSTGGAMVKDDMHFFHYNSWLGQYMILQIHDELVFDVPNERLEEAKKLVVEVMSRTRPEIGGHGIMVSVKTGPNMGELK